MFFISREEKRQISKALYSAEAARPVSETTPPEVTPRIEEFSRSLSNDIPIWVPVIEDQYGLFGWCSDGVLEKIRHDGGTIWSGWTIWEIPKILATAEFHAIWVDDASVPYDITPKPAREERILFVPDLSYPFNFNFGKRPRSRRVRLYEPPDRVPIIEARINGMKASQLAYETRRADRAGKTVVQWLEEKDGPDANVSLIESLIEVCDRCDKKRDAQLPRGGIFIPDAELQTLARRKDELIAKIHAAFRHL